MSQTERPRHLERVVVTESGESVCRCCGFVLSDRHEIVPDAPSVRDCKRMAPVYDSRTLGHTSPTNDKRHHLFPSYKERRANGINTSMDFLRDICMRYGYGESILAEATYLLRWAYAKNLVRTHRKEMTLACIYLAHRAKGVPVPLRAFLMRHTGSQLSDHTKKTPFTTRMVCSNIRLLKGQMMDIDAFRSLHDTSITDTSAKILWGLENTYGRRTILLAIRGLGRIGPALAGRNSNVVAATSLYICLLDGAAAGRAGNRHAEAHSRPAVAAACDVTDRTLRVAVKALRKAGFGTKAGRP